MTVTNLERLPAAWKVLTRESVQQIETQREDLKGKAVVLEFCATWCGPCVAAMPHLNELAEKFKDRPDQFIAITSEETDVFEQFLKQRQMKGWISLDPDSSTDTDYGVYTVPHTNVVDKTGTIRATTRPMDLAPPILNDLLVSLPVGSKKSNEPQIATAVVFANTFSHHTRPLCLFLEPAQPC